MYNNIVYLLAMVYILNGCAPAVIGATAATGLVLSKEKTVGKTVDDATIWTRIKSNFLQKNFDHMFIGVDVKVNEGRVLLTGYVPDAKTKMEAVKIVWSQEGVKEVMDEINISSQNDKLTLKEYSLDTWITTQLKTKLLVEKNIRSVNYNIETIEGITYLFGIAQNQQELDKVTYIASTIPHVKKVISFVRLKDSPLRQ
ncbi:Osmotically-inducible protein Y precursor [Rickettsiales bacterium Ac37b]|nr:Osmotically-inducible protein Y precursor [Rickettsiales bacterium Ac37b]